MQAENIVQPHRADSVVTEKLPQENNIVTIQDVGK